MDDKIIKLNLGSGPRALNDWINIDYGLLAFVHKFKIYQIIKFLIPNKYNFEWSVKIKFYNICKGLPYNDESVDFIYTSHFLEHVKTYEVEYILKECYRVMKNESIIRIVVPDIKKMVKKYVEHDNQYFEELKNVYNYKVYNDSLIDHINIMLYPEYNYVKKSGLIWKIIKFLDKPHAWMYDFESLSYLLKNVGFKKINQFEPFEGECPNIDFLDMHPLISLHVEAAK